MVRVRTCEDVSVEAVCRWVAAAVLSEHGAGHVVVGMWCPARMVVVVAVHSTAHHRSRLSHSVTDDSGLVVVEERATPPGSLDPARVAASLATFPAVAEAGVSVSACVAFDPTQDPQLLYTY